jgi:uncharacterized membrane protein YfcA
MEPATLALLAAAAFVVAALMVATGFGLATALTPLFLLAYDIKTAVVLVAVVHLANGLFRLALYRLHADWRIVTRFGLASVAGALAGAWLQRRVADPALEIGLGALLVVLGLVALLPMENPWKFPPVMDQLGGFLSGMLGGLIGNQGAVRSGYLLNYGLGKEAFIATGTAIACLIDVTRLPVYLWNYGAEMAGKWAPLAGVVAAAWAGTFVGKGLVSRLPLVWFRRIVAVMIVVAGAALIFAKL